MISSYYSIFVQIVALSPVWQFLTVGIIPSHVCISRRGREAFRHQKNKKKEYKLLAKVQIHSSARKNSPVKKNVSKKLQRD